MKMTISHNQPIRFGFWLSLLAISIGIISCADKTEQISGTITEVAPTKAKVSFENEHVTLIEVNIPSGQLINTHHAGERAMFALSPLEMSMTQNGEESTIDWQEGDTGWFTEAEVSFNNLLAKEAEFIYVSRKYPNLPGIGEQVVLDDISSAAPQEALLLLDNDKIRITRAELSSDDTIQVHYKMNSIVYALNNISLDIVPVGTHEKQEEVTLIGAPGTTEWVKQGNYYIHNSAEIPAKFVIFGFKQ